MNYYLFISGLSALFIVIGHFMIGAKLYLKPTLEAEFDRVPKKIMHALFHYSSVFNSSAAAALLYFSFLKYQVNGYQLVIGFIAIQYILNAVVQILIAITSKVENGLLTFFQWILFLITGIIALLGVL